MSETKVLLMILGGIFLGACASNPPPAETHDGLVLQDSRKVDELYLRPGAEFDSYTEFGLGSCEVAFRRNWLRDQNNSRIDLSNRVTQQDVDNIKDSLGAMCDEQFREALLQSPPYNLVEEFSQGEAVLLLRPSIINLDVAAPDTNTPGRSRSYTTEAGEMTLFLELVDGTTGETLARVVDRREAMDMGRMQWTNGVTNQADAQRALGQWAKQLREGLDRTLGRN